MRRVAAGVLVTVALSTAVLACRQFLPSNRYLQLRRVSTAAHSTADARTKFDHDRHARVLRDTNVTCVDCHRFDALIDVENEQKAKTLSTQAMHPGSAPCHFCHIAEETHVAKAPGTCTTCHDNLQPLRPEDHDFAWLKVHANMARVDSRRCESCHRQAECMDCHTRRDSIQTKMHDRNFRSFHGIQARANPMQCSSCHREDFCIHCHERGGAGSDG